MPNLKDIRRRIKSVQSTKKITQAMKMVAAAKVKRAENKVKANRPFSSELNRIFTDVYEALKNQTAELDGSVYKNILRDAPVKNVGIVVMSSDRGLCGAYNASIIRQALQLQKKYEEAGITPKFFLVGNKIIRSFKLYSNAEVLGSLGNMTAAPTPDDSRDISHQLVKAFQDHKIDAVQILYTRFKSMISYQVTLKPVFPVKGLIPELEHLLPAPEDMYPLNRHMALLPGVRPETLLEPNASEVLDTLVPLYLSNQFYNALLEASASELAARMTAMSNASNNAAEMIGKLTLIYNKARQASITQEILEIVSGANALA